MERDRQQWVADLQSDAPSVREAAWQDLFGYACRVAFVCLEKHGNLTESAAWQLAEDVAQEALADILDKLESFRGDSKFTTWAYRFVVNNAYEQLRRLYPPDWRSLDEDETVMLVELVPDLQTGTPELKAEENELVLAAQEVINTRLTERQRVVLLLHQAGHSPSEIAERIGTNRNNVDQLLFAARKRLKEELQNLGYDLGRPRVQSETQ